MLKREFKVLLLVPYVNGMFEGLEELGIGYIAAILRNKGNEVMLTSARWKMVDYDKIRAFKPDIAGIPVYERTKQAVYEISQKLKQLLPDIYVCIGGTQPTYNGEEMMKEAPFIDFAIKGEGELAMRELVSCLEQEQDIKAIRGLIFREGDRIISNTLQPVIGNLDGLPFPARDIIVENKLNVAQISTSRGCTGRCSFCSSQLFWKKWRGREVNNIVDEIEDLATKYGIKMFSFIDSSFEDPGIRSGRISRIAEEIIRRNLHIHYFIDVKADFHIDGSSALIELLKRSGLITVMIGIESGNDDDLKLYNKKATLADNQKTIELFRNTGVIVKCGFINFNPYSSFESLRKNIDFLEKYGFAFSLECTATRFVMYKGTSLYNRVVHDSLMKTEEFHETAYNFQDPRIEPLCDYVWNYMRQNDTTGKSFAVIRFFDPYFLIILSNCKTFFKEEPGHSAAYKLVIDFENEYKPQIHMKYNELNTRVAGWFRELLKLAENGWNSTIADELSAQYLAGEYLKILADSLTKMRNKMYISLSRLDSKYTSYLPNLY